MSNQILKDINGKVRSLQESEYFIVVKDDRYFQGKGKFIGPEYSFDINGNLIDTVFFYYGQNGDFIESGRQNCRYDSQNKLIFTSYSSDGYSDYWVEFNYDKSGKLIFEKRGGCNPYFKDYEYDEKGNLIYMKETTGDFVFENHYNLLYDEKGNLIQKTYNNGEKERYLFNDRNKVVETIIYDSDEIITLSHKYDENGNCIESSSIDSRDKYKFDNDSNLIESIQYYKNEHDCSWVKYSKFLNKNKLEEVKINFNDLDLNAERIIHKYIDFDEHKNWIKKIIVSNSGVNYMVVRTIDFF